MYEFNLQESGSLVEFIRNAMNRPAGELDPVDEEELRRTVINEMVARTVAMDLWKEGGRYTIDITQGRHWYTDSTFAEVTRGLWLIDPLVPFPDEAREVQWPPHPQGAVPIPSEVSVWFRGSDRVWRPYGLHTRPAPEDD